MTAEEAAEGLLPKEPLRPGKRVLLTGAVELKAAALDLESRPETKPADRGARGKPDRLWTSCPHRTRGRKWARADREKLVQ
ncbi:MAG TPA: hypothetical protein VJY33_02255, partial [Isosphaeraceae bacterium]|nr:hypothetical protein [Isosphaeraceae bacterium]